MEMSRSWSSAHDWKSCNTQKVFESSNLSISAKRETAHRAVFSFGKMRFEKGKREALETCRGHVSVPVCVPAQCLRRANLSISAKKKTAQQGGFFFSQGTPSPVCRFSYKHNHPE